MATEAVKPAEGKALTRVQAQRMTLRNLFETQKPELRKLLPRGMDLDRLERMALTECVKNPALLECTAESWALAMQTCAQQGLYPDSALGYMYLIPRNNSKKVGNEWKKFNEVTAQRGYQGDIQLARNTGEIADIYAEVVYTKDTYKVTKGLNRDIVHEPAEDDDPGELRAVYAVAKLKSGEVAFVTLRRSDVMRHKASAQGTDRADGPWKAHEAAMWKKTAIHELFKWLPKASEKMDNAVRSITGEGSAPIDVTAIGRSEVELEPRPLGLAEVTARLEAGAEEAEPPAPQAAPKDCPHKAVPPSRVAITPKGTTVVCVDCGQEFPGEADPATSAEPPAEAPSTVAELAPKRRRLE